MEAKLRKLLDKVTPRPWKASTNAGCKTIGGDKSGARRQTQYRDIISTYGLTNEAEDGANAELIVLLRNAAPEFLRVIEAARACYENDDFICDNGPAALTRDNALGDAFAALDGERAMTARNGFEDGGR